MENDLKTLLIKCGAVQYGDFTLSSGKHSNYYINLKKAVTDPAILKIIAKKITKLITADKIAGIELGSVPIAVAVALESSKKFVIVRKQSKTHGTQTLVEGSVIPSERIIVIEDVTTTGNSALRAVRILRNLGASVTTVLTVVDREEGGAEMLKKYQIELVSLVRARDLMY